MYVAQAASGNNYWLVYLMFLIAGVLAGGTWSVYMNGSRGFAVVLGVLAGIAVAAGILWMVGEMRA